MTRNSEVENAFGAARDRYARLGVDVDAALKRLEALAISLQCWQGDDVGGFEKSDTALGGGLAVTGNHPGKARNHDELRRDMEKALSLIPGCHRVNLHAIYGEFGGKKVDRDAIGPEHFQGWIDWARAQGIGLDFNATCFSHPKADSGFTLSSRDAATRAFWIDHVQRCRAISAHVGRELKNTCVHNLWVPDGSKDLPVDRFGHRARLRESLDEIFAESHDRAHMVDSVESKLFGLGSEAFVVGSHEFYLGYALTKGLMVCLDTGHFHPTESVADKIPSLLQFCDELLLHVSRGVRWDSDHVVIVDDELRRLAEEIVRAQALDRVRVALDFFDGSINRIGAWVIGVRAAQRAFLMALLEPHAKLKEYEDKGELFARLGLMEEAKTLPIGAVWDYFCRTQEVPVGESWIDAVRRYEKDVLSKRS